MKLLHALDALDACSNLVLLVLIQMVQQAHYSDVSAPKQRHCRLFFVIFHDFVSLSLVRNTGNCPFSLSHEETRLIRSICINSVNKASAFRLGIYTQKA